MAVSHLVKNLDLGTNLESEEDTKGHEFYMKGAYTTPNLLTAWGYARPQVVFNDDMYYRIVLEAEVHEERARYIRRKGGNQLVFAAAAAIESTKVWFRANDPPPIKGR